MRLKTIIIFVLAMAGSLVAAEHRFYDSSHSMRLIRSGGGTSLHPLILDEGRDSYTVITTATVLPPYRGDMKVAIEGYPSMRYELYDSEPIIDLGVHRRPEFYDNTFHDVQPRDRIALWMVMKPDRGSDCHGRDGQSKGTPALTFRDTRTNRTVLSIPILFKSKGKEPHGAEHH